MSAPAPVLYRAHRITIGSAIVCGVATLAWGIMTGSGDVSRYVVAGLGGAVAVALAFYLRWFGRKLQDKPHGR